MAKKVGVIFIILCFCLNGILVPEIVYAQATILNLPVPGTMVSMTSAFLPTVIRGIKIDVDNPLHMDFIVDRGQAMLSIEDLKKESKKIIKYFLAALTTPEDDLWVNLSPYEKNKIIPLSFGLTEMGRDMLAQDYILKQLTSSLIYPESNLGKKFWRQIYDKAQAQFGTTNVPVNTFNKVWILPDKAVIFENGDKAFVVKAHLKVMLEADYLSRKKHWQHMQAENEGLKTQDVVKISDVSTSVIRDVIVPEITKEVNEGSNFMPLRQIYYSLILAAWFKQNLRESFLGKTYVEKNKISGVDVKDKDVKQKIYRLYLRAFKKGVYNYIKEELDPGTQQVIPRKYFSGGTTFDDAAMKAATEVISPKSTPTQIAQARREAEGLAPHAVLVGAHFEDTGDNAQIAQENVALLRTTLQKAIQRIANNPLISEDDLLDKLQLLTISTSGLHIAPDKARQLAKAIKAGAHYALLSKTLLETSESLNAVIQALESLEKKNVLPVSPSRKETPDDMKKNIAVRRALLNTATGRRIASNDRAMLAQRFIGTAVLSGVPHQPTVVPDTEVTRNVRLPRVEPANSRYREESFIGSLKGGPIIVTKRFDSNKKLSFIVGNFRYLVLFNKGKGEMELHRFPLEDNKPDQTIPRREMGDYLLDYKVRPITTDRDELQEYENQLPSIRISHDRQGYEFELNILESADPVTVRWAEPVPQADLSVSKQTANSEISTEDILNDPVKYVVEKLIEQQKPGHTYEREDNKIYERLGRIRIDKPVFELIGEKGIKLVKINSSFGRLGIKELLGSRGLLTLQREGLYTLGLRRNPSIPQQEVTAQQELTAIETTRIAKTVVSSFKRGGIDFNSNELQIEKRGTGTKFNTIDFKNPNQAMITGLTPVIVQVIPITNLPVLLGLSPKDQPAS